MSSMNVSSSFPGPSGRVVILTSYATMMPYGLVGGSQDKLRKSDVPSNSNSATVMVSLEIGEGGTGEASTRQDCGQAVRLQNKSNLLKATSCKIRLL